MEPCKYCDENVIYFHCDLSSAPWTRLKLYNWGGDVAIVAHGDNDCSYEPKFCPECGRRLFKECDN